MALVPQSKLRNVTGIEEHQLELIRAYLQGAVYCWVKNRSGERFAARDLVGGENTDWSGTPLQNIYEQYLDSGRTEVEAFEAAAIDVGWILKRLLAEDSRVFDFDNSQRVNMYRWQGAT